MSCRWCTWLSLVWPVITGNMPAQMPEWEVLWRQAEALHGRAQLTRAEALYRQILAPPRPTSLNDLMVDAIALALAENLVEQGRLADAIVLLESAEPADADHRLRFAYTVKHLRERLESSQKAIRKGLQRIARTAAESWGYEDLVRGLAVQGRAHTAIRVLEAERGAPLSIGMGIALARAAESEDPPAAAALYAQWVLRHPRERQLREAQLQWLGSRGNPAEAVRAWQAALAIWPDDPTLRFGLARQFERAEQPARALQQYQLLLAADDAQPDLWLKVAALMEQAGDPAQAQALYLEHIQRWPQLAPSDPRCHVQRSDAYTQLLRLLERQGLLTTLPALAHAQHWSDAQRAAMVRALRQAGHAAMAHEPAWLDESPTAPLRRC